MASVPATLVMLVGLGGCVIHAHRSRFESEVVLPLERRLYLTVPGRTDDARGRFIIDTGSEETMVTRRWVERSRIPTDAVHGSFVIRMWGGLEKDVLQLARMRNLRFSEAWVETHDAPVLDVPLPAAGVLGMDIMGAWSVLYDLERGEVRLLEPRSVRRRLGSLYPGVSWQALPMPLVGNRPHLDLVLQGVPHRFLIDTGSSRSTLPPQLVKELGLRPLRPAFVASTPADLEFELARLQAWVRREIADQRRGEMVLNLEDPLRYRIESLQIGTRRISMPVEALERGGGLLGWDLLGRWPFVVDAPGRRFWIPR